MILLIARGDRASFVLVGGRRIATPQGSFILHDPTGAAWPRESVLVMVIGKSGQPLARADAHVRRHFGHVLPKRGDVDTPPRSFRGWEEIGEVARVEYHFRGQHYAPEGHAHPFGQAGPLAWFGKKRPVLYRRGEAMRLEPVTWDENGARG